MLAQFYTRLKALGKPFEVVFARCVASLVVMCVCSLSLWCWVVKAIERVAHVVPFLWHPTHSVDQEEAAFDDYFKQMPWLALPFDGDEREQFMSTYQVRLSGATDKTNTHPNEHGGRKGDWLMQMYECRQPPAYPPPPQQQNRSRASPA